MRNSLPMTASRACGLLELQPCADPGTVKQAYLDLVRVWHPDRFTDDARLRQRATDKLADLNAAYAVLKQTTPAFQFEHSPSVGAELQPLRTRRRIRVQVVRRRHASAARFVVSAVAAAAAVLTILAVLLSGFTASPAEGSATQPTANAPAPPSASEAPAQPPQREARSAGRIPASLVVWTGQLKSPFSRDLERAIARSVRSRDSAPIAAPGASSAE